MAIAEDLSTRQDLQSRFIRLAEQWRSKSYYMSNESQMAMLPPYQKIIGMGPQAVPLILEELRREPGFWFWALQMITDADPVPLEDRGKMSKMVAAWIAWGIANGYLPQ